MSSSSSINEDDSNSDSEVEPPTSEESEAVPSSVETTDVDADEPEIDARFNSNNAAPRGSAGLPSSQVEGPRGAVGGLPCPSQAESRPPSRTVCRAASRAEASQNLFWSNPVIRRTKSGLG
ncbi:hypothetical protein E3N88_15194 [Mikania micrantha]|uniref:Uncharacterized protein n=1 Tax=Mikania micrantha TaxID=192012 RepID=A0A5N6NUY6_9ASTR|nr:hypothetical protein E3N88_15194 [Mikania micrantha]